MYVNSSLTAQRNTLHGYIEKHSFFAYTQKRQLANINKIACLSVDFIAYCTFKANTFFLTLQWKTMIVLLYCTSAVLQLEITSSL